MVRPLRIEFPGAVYHITARGNARAKIFKDDADRDAFLSVLEQVLTQFDWLLHAYCLMDNHYHLMIETTEANLSAGMRQLNGVYTQRFNRRHRRVGHVFQGRFKAIVVDRDSYLLELCRYVVLNPVRARMVREAKDCLDGDCDDDALSAADSDLCRVFPDIQGPAVGIRLGQHRLLPIRTERRSLCN